MRFKWDEGGEGNGPSGADTQYRLPQLNYITTIDITTINCTAIANTIYFHRFTFIRSQMGPVVSRLSMCR